MKPYVIYIYIDRKERYTIGGSENYLNVDVYKDEPFDRLSGIFKRYSHVIEYPKETYSGSYYILYIYDHTAWFYKYRFTYNHPKNKVSSVDLFFSSKDKDNTTPLVVGFNEEYGSDTLYYTYNYLKGKGSISEKLPNVFFKKNDLITRLLEEKILAEGKIQHILINVRLRPSNTTIRYPNSGLFDNKISVSKSNDVAHFDKYEHNFINLKVTDGMHLNFDNDSLFFADDHGLFRSDNLKCVEVYFHKANFTTPFIIVLQFNKILSRYFVFYEFVNLLKKSIQIIKISHLKQFEYKDVSKLLMHENDKYRPKLFYIVDQTERYSYRITFKTDKDKPTTGFTKYTHTPENYYKIKLGYVIFNGDGLMKKEEKGGYEPIKAIQNITYKSICVYYGSKYKNNPLLVQLISPSSLVHDKFFVYKQDSGLRYWESVSIERGHQMSKQLIERLEKAESDLVSSIVILTDQTSGAYGDFEINEAVSKLDPPKEIALAQLDSSSIRVTNKTREYPKCVGKYRLYEHDLTASVKARMNYGLKLFIPNNTSGYSNYSDVYLYNDTAVGDKNRLEYIYYMKGYEKLYVFFNDKESKPILICYYGKGYRPKSRQEYYTTWVRDNRIVSCPCPLDSLVLQILDEIANSLKEKETKVQHFREEETIPKFVETVFNLTEDTASGSSPELSYTDPPPVDPLELETFEESPPSPPLGPTPPLVPIGTPIKDEKIVDIDLTTKGPTTYGTAHTVAVTEQKAYDNSNLFCLYTHYLNDQSPFGISSFKASGINLNTELFTDTSNVRSVDVYFNIRLTNIPVILTINLTNNQTKYYKVSTSENNIYNLVQDSGISTNLCDNLIEQSDRVNQTVTYRIEKTASYGLVQVIEQKHPLGYTVFTHLHSKVEITKGYVLYNQRLLVGKSRQEFSTLDVQDKPYQNVVVYALNTETSYPLLIELKESQSSSSYFQKKELKGSYWEGYKFTHKSDEDTIEKLNDICYVLKKSAIVEIDKNTEMTYPMKLISNLMKSVSKDYERNSYLDGKPLIPQKNVQVSAPSKIKISDEFDYSLYYYVSHEIDYSTISNVDKKDIAGLRLFITKKIDSQAEEIFFYNVDKNPKEKDRIFLSYPPIKTLYNKIYVYFYDRDPRPLLICYNRRTFKRLKDDDNSKWVVLKEYNKCPGDSDILKILKEIHLKMKKKIMLSDEDVQVNVDKSPVQPFGSFYKYGYTPKVYKTGPDEQFKLPKSVLIGKSGRVDSNIKKLLDELNTRAFDSVNVYDIKNDPNLNDTLLFEFVDGSDRTHLQLMDRDGKYWINQQVKYRDDRALQKQLLTMLENANDTLVYEIDKTQDGYNKYISLKSEEDRPIKNFIKCTHTPKAEHRSKKSLILYDGERLMEKKSDDRIEILDEIQTSRYQNIVVYFGKNHPNVPLIVEFFKLDYVSTNEHCVNKKESIGQYWEASFSILFENDLIQKLKKTEFDLSESLVILTNKGQGTYDEQEIGTAISNLQPAPEINTMDLIFKNITVKLQTYSELSCVMNYGYGIYTHILTENPRELKISGQYGVGMRFLISSSEKSDYYNEINFYSGDSPNETDREYIYYKEDSNQVYVYFYKPLYYINEASEKDFRDPRPLLICYGNAAYIPYNYGYYNQNTDSRIDYRNWVKVKDIKYCLCKDNIKSKEPILQALTKVVGFLNTVEINPKFTPFRARSLIIAAKPTTITYSIHKYVKVSVELKISSTNMKCYRKYTYESHESTNLGNTFRLGNVIHSSDSRGQNKLDYLKTSENKYQPLSSVSVYYNLYDFEHDYPLLVVLFFEGRHIDCYKLSHVSGENEFGELKWEKMKSEYDPSSDKADREFMSIIRNNEMLISEHESLTQSRLKRLTEDQQNMKGQLEDLINKSNDIIESKLYEIRTGLKIQFSSEEKKRYLFDPKNCTEDNVSVAVIAGSTVGTVGGVGAVGTGVALAKFPEILIPTIKALI